MQTLSYGFQLPQNGDKGSPLFAALAANIQQTNDHDHDGVNSALLSSANVQASTATLSAAAWALYGGPAGHYRQQVTMAAGFTFDDTNIVVRTPAGAQVYATIEKISATSFYIYTTDNTIGFNLVYGG